MKLVRPKKKYKGNGCGPSYMPRSLKDDYFVDACMVHDVEYHDGENRRKSDKKFVKAMLKTVDKKESKWYRKAYRKSQAWFFYGLVRLFGWASHNKK